MCRFMTAAGVVAILLSTVPIANAASPESIAIGYQLLERSTTGTMQNVEFTVTNSSTSVISNLVISIVTLPDDQHVEVGSLMAGETVRVVYSFTASIGAIEDAFDRGAVTLALAYDVDGAPDTVLFTFPSAE